MALKTDGTLWSWGYNIYGQLGLGNSTYYSSPKQIGALTNWSKINCGASHAGVIKTNGTLWMWGYGYYGQLGLGNTVYYSSPKQVGSDTTWAQICCGLNFNTALRTNGTLWTWGQNAFGQLGIGTSGGLAFCKSSPTQVGSLTTWSLLVSTSRSSYALAMI